MKISDRDFKLIMIVIIAVVIALPILFVIRPTKEKIDAVTAEIATLSERQSYLSQLDANRSFYLDSIDLLNKERNKLIEGYAEGIKGENSIMFLANTERDIPIKMKAIAFVEEEPTAISEGYTNENGEYVEGLAAITQTATVAYLDKYENVKSFLSYIKNSKTRMVVKSISMKLNTETGLIDGVFVLDQYAISGEGRTLKKAVIPEFTRGMENIFGNYTVVGEEEEEQEQEQEEED